MACLLIATPVFLVKQQQINRRRNQNLPSRTCHMFPGKCPPAVPPHRGRGASGGIFWHFVNFIFQLNIQKSHTCRLLIGRHLLLCAPHQLTACVCGCTVGCGPDYSEFVFKLEAGIWEFFCPGTRGQALKSLTLMEAPAKCDSCLMC